MWIKEEDKVKWTSSICLMMLTISLVGIENSKCYSIFNDEMWKGDDEMMKCCMIHSWSFDVTENW